MRRTSTSHLALPVVASGLLVTRGASASLTWLSMYFLPRVCVPVVPSTVPRSVLAASAMVLPPAVVPSACNTLGAASAALADGVLPSPAPPPPPQAVRALTASDSTSRWGLGRQGVGSSGVMGMFLVVTDRKKRRAPRQVVARPPFQRPHVAA